MTNIMREKPLAAIHERAMAFVSRCVEAGTRSVDIYVCLGRVIYYRKLMLNFRFCCTATHLIV